MRILTANMKCNYWGYEPSAVDMARSRRSRPGERAAIIAEIATIRKAGLTAFKSGFRSKAEAVAAAKRIETTTGVDMTVYSHDYV